MHLYAINFEKVNRVAFPHVEKEFTQYNPTNYLTDEELVYFATPISLGEIVYKGDGVDPSPTVFKFAETNPDSDFDFLVGKVDKLEEDLKKLGGDFTGRLVDPINVHGGDVGNYKDGDVIPKDTSYSDVLENILTINSPPVYIPPSLILSSNYDNIVSEVGDVVEVKITPHFNVGDSGGLNRYVLKRGSTVLLDVGNAISFSEIIPLGDTPLVYTAYAYYSDGSVKTTSLGDPFPLGKIVSGTINNSVSILSQRKIFFGSSLDVPTLTSDFIRGLKSSFFKKGDFINFDIPVNSKSVIVAFPNSIFDIDSILYPEFFNYDVKTSFVVNKIQVKGSNSAPTSEYIVLQYNPDCPFLAKTNYKIII